MADPVRPSARRPISLTRRRKPLNVYVMAKLTLHVPDNLVVAAKREAAHRRTSVSRLVSDYFRAFGSDSQRVEEAGRLPPVTASLVGCIRGADPGREAYVDYLERKHT